MFLSLPWKHVEPAPTFTHTDWHDAPGSPPQANLQEPSFISVPLLLPINGHSQLVDYSATFQGVRQVKKRWLSHVYATLDAWKCCLKCFSAVTVQSGTCKPSPVETFETQHWLQSPARSLVLKGNKAMDGSWVVFWDIAAETLPAWVGHKCAAPAFLASIDQDWAAASHFFRNCPSFLCKTGWYSSAQTSMAGLS